jgi:hypothetical protein
VELNINRESALRVTIDDAGKLLTRGIETAHGGYSDVAEGYVRGARGTIAGLLDDDLIRQTTASGPLQEAKAAVDRILGQVPGTRDNSPMNSEDIGTALSSLERAKMNVYT